MAPATGVEILIYKNREGQPRMRVRSLVDKRSIGPGVFVSPLAQALLLHIFPELRPLFEEP